MKNNMEKLTVERYENSKKYCSRTVVDSVVDSVVDFENLSLAEISLSTRNEIGAIAFQACTLSHSDTSLSLNSVNSDLNEIIINLQRETRRIAIIKNYLYGLIIGSI